MSKIEQKRTDAIEKVMDVVLDPDSAPAHIRKAIDSLITEVWNEAIKECEGCVPEEKGGWGSGVTASELQNNYGHNSCREQTLQAIRSKL